MKNFKPGQKVVYRDNGINDVSVDKPKDGSILEIKERSKQYVASWYIVGFETSLRGAKQSFCESVLFPLEEKSKTVTLEIKKIKLEPKKVLEKTEEFLHAN